MTSSAPRYDARLIDAIYAADDGKTSFAEICRRVGRAAEHHGLTRPSYVHVRRVVIELRETAAAETRRRDARRRIAESVITDLLVMRRIDPYEVAERLRRADDA